MKEEFALFTRGMRGDFLAGPLSAADYALYPVRRVPVSLRAEAVPSFDADELLTPELAAWKARIEALPYFDQTYPPHWKQPTRTVPMKLSTTAFADDGGIPAEFAFCKLDPATHVTLSANRNPDFAWSGRAGRHAIVRAAVPRPGRAFARRRRQQGRPQRAGDRCRAWTSSIGCWSTCRRTTPAIARGAHPNGVTPRGKPGPHAPRRRSSRHQRLHRLVRERHATWSGDYYGYDGPCPPWNDELVAPLRVHAVCARRCRGSTCRSDSRAPMSRNAMRGPRSRARHRSAGATRSIRR